MRNYLVALRKEKGLTQKQLAEKLDISESYYNQIENGERQKRMDITIIDRLSKAFKIPVSAMAHMKVASGVTDYNTAIRQACKALSDSGLRTVYYESGRSDRIEVAVRRALMTSVS